VTYQPQGQGQRRRSVFVPAGAETALREAIEAEYGGVSGWWVRSLTPGRRGPHAWDINTLPDVGESSQTVDAGVFAEPATERGMAVRAPPDG
jgi:hypothetical protein